MPEAKTDRRWEWRCEEGADGLIWIITGPMREPFTLVLIFDYMTAPVSQADINPATSSPLAIWLFVVHVMLTESNVTGKRLQKCQGVTGIDGRLEKIEK